MTFASLVFVIYIAHRLPKRISVAIGWSARGIIHVATSVYF